MSHYLAFVFADDDGFGFTLPDIDGFTAYAESTDFYEAVSIARETLASHMELVVDAGGELPIPRSLAALRADPELREEWDLADLTTMLPALLPAGRTKRINITMDEHTLGQLDRVAKERKITRSAALAEAAREFIAR